jgi:membrane protein YqaA with SNARE-associated domain
MSISFKEKLDYWIDQSYSDKLKQREALENAHGNFVEPHINQLITVNTQLLPTMPIAPHGFCIVSGWLVLTLIYCVWVRSKPPIK